MIKYCKRKDCVCDEDGVAHTVYGVDVYDEGRHLRSIPDIFLDEGRMDRLIEKFNELQLLPEHIDDVIENEIG